MSLVFPSVDIYSATLPGDYSTLASLSPSGRSSTQAGLRHLWRSRLDFRDLPRADYAQLQAFFMTCQGGRESFTIQLPHWSTPRGVATGSPIIASVTDANNVSVSGLTPNISGILKKGDFFKIANDDKAYRLTENVNSNGSGVGAFTFYPPLRNTPSVGAAVVIQNIPFTMMLDGQPSWQIIPGENDFYNCTVDLIEALN